MPRNNNRRTAGSFLMIMIALLLISVTTLMPSADIGDGTEVWSTEDVQTNTRQTNASQNGTPPIFLDYNVTPAKGDTETDFIFLAWVVDPDGQGIAFVQVVVDGNPLGMGSDFDAGDVGSNRSRFREVINLEAGGHTVYFQAEDNNGSMANTSANPIEIKVSKAEEEENPYDRYICLVLIIIVTLVLMIWTFRQFKKRRDAQDLMYASDGEEEDTGIRCTECDKPVPEDARECPHCKERFEGTEEVCPFCDTKVPEGVERCPLCKKRFKAEKGSKRTLPKLSCPECGAIVDPGQKTCPGCDSDISDATRLKAKKGKAAEKRGDIYMCSICGGDVKESAPSCKKCGARFS